MKATATFTEEQKIDIRRNAEYAPDMIKLRELFSYGNVLDVMDGLRIAYVDHMLGDGVSESAVERREETVLAAFGKYRGRDVADRIYKAVDDAIAGVNGRSHNE